MPSPAGPPLTLVVFDLDGTLVDSRKDLVDSANALIRELGGRELPDDAITGMIGEGATLLVARALAAGDVDPAPPDALARFLGIYEDRMLVHTRVYPGIREVLERLAGRVGLAVLTNKPARETARVLEGLDLARFFGSAVIGGDGPLPRKPDPAGLLQLVRAQGATPDTTLLVGDSWIDRETAERAGIRVCLARWGFGFRFDPDALETDDLVAESPEALADLLDARLAGTAL
jgi:phosphoglycolate phosphatase